MTCARSPSTGPGCSRAPPAAPTGCRRGSSCRSGRAAGSSPADAAGQNLPARGREGRSRVCRQRLDRHAARARRTLEPAARTADPWPGKPIGAPALEVFSRQLSAATQWKQLRGIRTTNERAASATAPAAAPPARSASATPARARSAATTRPSSCACAASSTHPGQPRAVVNGEYVTFRGRLRGGWIPAAGALVELQVYTRGAWRTFAQPRAPTQTAAGATSTASRPIRGSARVPLPRPHPPPGRLPVRDRRLAHRPRPRARPLTGRSRNFRPVGGYRARRGLRPPTKERSPMTLAAPATRPAQLRQRHRQPRAVHRARRHRLRRRHAAAQQRRPRAAAQQRRRHQRATHAAPCAAATSATAPSALSDLAASTRSTPAPARPAPPARPARTPSTYRAMIDRAGGPQRAATLGTRSTTARRTSTASSSRPTSAAAPTRRRSPRYRTARSLEEPPAGRITVHPAAAQRAREDLRRRRQPGRGAVSPDRRLLTLRGRALARSRGATTASAQRRPPGKVDCSRRPLGGFKGCGPDHVRRAAAVRRSPQAP